MYSDYEVVGENSVVSTQGGVLKGFGTKRSLFKNPVIVSPLLISFLLISFLMALGCSEEKKETGILLRLTASENVENLSVPINKLKLYVAYGDANTDGSVFIQDREASGTEIHVGGRNLSVDPYEVLVLQDKNKKASAIRVVVLGYTNGEEVAWGELTDPTWQEFMLGKVVSRMVKIHTSAEREMPYVITETGCVLSKERQVLMASANDHDCDGFTTLEDCDDEAGHINPGNTEVCDNGIDDDCDGITDEETDNDQDGYSNCNGDCNDDNPTVYPGAPELCDGIDNDCNELCDEEFDVDGDHHTACLDEISDLPVGTKILADGSCLGKPRSDLYDCDDLDPEVHPGVEEQCDGRDNNCDGVCDEGWDEDGDGWNICGTWDPRLNEGDFQFCGEPSQERMDCYDENADIYPTAPDEYCDGVDTNCNPYDWAGVTETCFSVETMGEQDVCLEGTRVCGEPDNGGWGECVLSGTETVLPIEVCDTYEYCLTQHPYSPLACLESNLTIESHTCQVFKQYSTPVYPCVEQPHYPLPEDANANFCTWQLRQHPNGMDGWNVYLSDADNTHTGDTVDGCEDITLYAIPTYSAPEFFNVNILLTINGVLSTVYPIHVNTFSMQCSTEDDLGMECSF